jgi:hypothetical protein
MVLGRESLTYSVGLICTYVNSSNYLPEADNIQEIINKIFQKKWFFVRWVGYKKWIALCITRFFGATKTIIGV